MLTLAQVAEILGVPCNSHPERVITGLNSLDVARPGDLSVLGDERYLKQYKTTQAAAVLVSRKIRLQARPDVPVLLVDDADLAMVQIMHKVAKPIQKPAPGIHPSAVIDATAIVGDNPFIGPLVVIGARTKVGKNVQLHPGVVIGDDCVLGDDCILYPNVVVRERITIGHRVILNSGAVLGTDGFGYKWDGKQHAKIPQIGSVVIEDDVEIGSNTCVDRAKFDETRIGKGTKIDNLVQIAHNVTTGQHCIICGLVGVAGTVKIGHGVVLGGAAAVRDHIQIGDRVRAAGHSSIVTDLTPGTAVSGQPAKHHRQSLREQSAISRLPQMLVRLRQLEDEVKALRDQAPPSDR